MTAENIIVLVILIICAVPFIILGIVQIRNRKPVGFWSGEIPPEVSRVPDTAAYNKKHGIMWIVYGVGMLLSFFIGFLFGGGIGASLLVAVEICGGIIVMIFYHNYLYKKYVI